MHHTLMHHAHMHYDQGTYMYMHRADMHHVYMHQGQCMKFMKNFPHHTYIHQTPRIALSVGSSGTKFQPHHTRMRYSQGSRITNASYINASCTYQDQEYMHHTYIHQSQRGT